MWLFYLTIVFAARLSCCSIRGSAALQACSRGLDRISISAETQLAENRYGPTFNRYLEQGLAVVAEDPAARAIGQRLFLTYCAQCHGSDAGGGIGFPSLRDKDWLYGGEPETIKASIMDGRNGVMPALGSAVAEAEGATQRGALRVEPRRTHARHAQSGLRQRQVRRLRGMPWRRRKRQQGAGRAQPDRSTSGSTADREAAIVETIMMGRKGQMPAHKDFLGEAKAHLLAAYVYSLSLEPGADAVAEGVRRCRKNRRKRNKWERSEHETQQPKTRSNASSTSISTCRASGGRARPAVHVARPGAARSARNLVESLAYGTLIAIAGWLIWAYAETGRSSLPRQSRASS